VFTLTFPVTSSDIAELKTDLGNALCGVKSSHRCEALGRGLGFKTYASLLAAARAPSPVMATADGAAFSAYLAAHDFQVEPKPFYLAVARTRVRAVLATDTRLTLHGIGVGRPKRKDDGNWETAREHYGRVLQSREEFLGDDGLEQFLLSLAFVGRVEPTKTIRPGTGSYRLKHIAENYSCSYPAGGRLGPRYVSNGALIAAAVHTGFRYKTYIDDLGYDSLNVNFNMSKSSLDDLDCETRPDGACAERRRFRAERRHDWSLCLPAPDIVTGSPT